MRAVILAPLMDGATVLDPQRCFASSSFITRHDDPLIPNQIFSGRLLNRSFDVSVRVGTVFWGDSSQTTFGALDFANDDHALDVFRQFGVRNRGIEVRVGDPEQFWQDWRVEFTGIAETPSFILVGEGSALRIALSDLSQLLDKPIVQAAYSSGALANKPHPLAIGLPLNVPATMSDPATMQYDCLAGGYVLAVRDQGDPLAVLSQWIPNGLGFQMLISPVGRLTADVEGPRSTLLHRTQFVDGFVEYVLEQFGITNIHPDIYGVLAFLGYELGYFSDKAVTGKQIMDELAASYGAGWFFDKLGRFNLIPLTPPSSTAVAVITESMVIGTVNARPDLARGFSPVAAALRNWHVHSPSEIAGSLTAVGSYQLIAQQLQQPFRAYLRGAPVTKLPDWDVEISEAEMARVTSDFGIGTLLVNETHAQAEADRWRALFADRPWFYDVKVTSTADVLALERFQTIELTVPKVGKGALAVRPFGLDATNVLVVGWDRRGNDLETTLTVRI